MGIAVGPGSDDAPRTMDAAAAHIACSALGTLPPVNTLAAVLVGGDPERALADVRRLLEASGVPVALYRRAGDRLAPFDGAPALDEGLASLVLAGNAADAVVPLVEGRRTIGALALGTPLARDDETTLAGLLSLGLGRLHRAVAEPEPAAAPRTADFLERVFEALPTAVVVSEPGTHRILSANRAYLDLVGLSAEDVLGALPPYAWWAEPPHIPVESWLRNHRGEEWSQLFRHSSGRQVPVEGRSFTLLDADGDPEREIALVTDQSQRRQFERQLVQSGKMAALGELASGVAHEINNPLFAILGLVEFLLKDAAEGTKARERLLLVQQTGLEIKEIVRALLDFAREGSDDFRLLDLHETVRGTLDLVRRTSAARGVELLELSPAEPVPVRASGGQLKQILLNLVTNAQQAMPDGGTVTVELERVGEWALVTVADTGPGIPADDVGRVFDPFFTTKRELGGTGLGLSVSLGIAQMHGGELAVVSEEGHGAAFTLRLPIAREAPA
jgi:PAS domain S-box-containing protein